MSDCLFENLEPRLLMDGDGVADAGSWANAQALQFQDAGYYRQATYASTVDDANDTDLFWFTAEQAGTTRVVMKRTGGLLPRIVLYDSQGTQIDYNSTTRDYAIIDFEAEAGETYYLKAHGCRGSFDDYVVGVRNLEQQKSRVWKDIIEGWANKETPFELNPTDKGENFEHSYRASINGWGDVDLFKFTSNFTGNGEFYIRNRTSRLNVRLRVYDENWNYVGGDRTGVDSAAIETNLSQGEIYYIVADGNGRHGYYDVRVRALEGAQLPVSPNAPWVDPQPEPDPAPAPDDDDPAPAPQPDPDPAVEPVTIDFDAGVLTIHGTDQADLIGFSQTGDTIYVVNAGQTRIFSGVTKIAMHLGDGDDEISLGNVTLTTWVWGQNGDDILDGGAGVDHIYGGAGNDYIRGRDGADILVTIGGGSDTVYGDYGWDQFWGDSSDTLYSTSSERTGGYVNTIAEFYQPYTNDSSNADYVSLELNGQNFKDPTTTSTAYVYADYSGYELFTDGPEFNDVRQGYIGDCYFLAALSGIANVDPSAIRNAIVDLGDGTYAVRYMRSGEYQYLRIDGDLPERYGSLIYARMNSDKELWVGLMEKAYAHFRRDSDSYLSISGGWMSEVYYAILGQSGDFDWISGATANTAYNMIAGALNNGEVVTLGSKSTAASPIVTNHAYTVHSAWTDNSGNKWVRVYNPWGYDGRGSDSNTSDGLVTLAAGDVGVYFSAVCSVAV